MPSNERRRRGEESEHLEHRGEAASSEKVGIYREMYHESLTGSQNRVLLIRTDRELTRDEVQLLEANGYRVIHVHSLAELRKEGKGSEARKLLYGAQCVTESWIDGDTETWHKAAIVIDARVFEEGKQDDYVNGLFVRAMIYGKIIHLADIS